MGEFVGVDKMVNEDQTLLSGAHSAGPVAPAGRSLTTRLDENQLQEYQLVDAL